MKLVLFDSDVLLDILAQRQPFVVASAQALNTVKIFEKFGYAVDHQTGSHIILWHESKPIFRNQIGLLYYVLN